MTPSPCEFDISAVIQFVLLLLDRNAESDVKMARAEWS
jgi:hypothetical protein